jgi:hypothetical protein
MDKKKTWLLIDLIILIVLIVLISSIYQTAKALAINDSNKSIILTIQTSKVLVSNNSVGNEWWTGAAINNEEVGIGSEYTIEVDLDDEISLKAAAEEMDSMPDQGLKEKKVKVRNLILTEPNRILLEVPVVENRGRYTGNRAVWQFTFTMQRKVTFTDIIKQVLEKNN